MWFERLFGFPESSYEETRRQFAVADGRLRSLANGRSFAIGEFATPTLEGLRARGAASARRGTLRVSHHAIGDVLELHARAENAGALFQVASQFNCLEFPGPSTVPEDGVSGYAHDPTQGPACSLAAAAATVYRNYFVPVGDRLGQTRDHQLDNLDGLAAALGEPGRFFEVRNGYTFSTDEQLAELGSTLAEHDREALLGKVKIGVQHGVGVTFSDRFTATSAADEPIVSQAFCSAISCSYSGLGRSVWAPLATLVLDASYEATLWAAAVNPSAVGTKTVWLTLLGGGAFGNDSDWIAAAIGRALHALRDVDLDVRIAHYRDRDPDLERRIDTAATGVDHDAPSEHRHLEPKPEDPC